MAINVVDIDVSKVEQISKIKNEPKWMTDFRVKAYKKFIELKNPLFGPEIKLDFSIINYYKKMDDKIHNDWNDLPTNIKETFDKIGLPEAEKKYLAGVGAQYESEAIYHNMIKELEEKNVKVTIDSKDHTTELANKIMRTVQENFSSKVNVTVEFKK